MNTRITFTGEDAGLTSVMQKIRQMAEETARFTIQEGQAQSKTSKEIVRDLEDQIKTIEKRNRIEFEGQKLNLERGYQNKSTGALDSEKGKLKEDYQKEKQSLLNLEKEDRLQTGILRELLQQFKKSGDNARFLQDQQEVENDRNDRDKKDGILVVPTPTDDSENNTREKKEKDKQDGLKATTLVATEMIVSSLGTMAGAKTGQHAVGDLIKVIGGGIGGLVGAIPMVGAGLGAGIMGISSALSTMYMRHLETAETNFKASAGARGMTGGKSFSAVGLGLDTSEVMPVARELALASGRGGKNETLDLLKLSKAYGLDNNVLMGVAGSSKMGDQGALLTKVQGLIDIFATQSKKTGGGLFAGGDYSKLTDFLTFQSRLLDQQSKSFEDVSSTKTAGILAQFIGTKGGWNVATDFRAGERISALDQSLRNPANEYQTAMNFANLSKLNPNASFWELEKMQSKGLAQEGMLGETIKSIRQQFGTGEAAYREVNNRFGLNNPEAAENLFKSWEDNPDQFNTIGTEGIEGMLGNMRGRVQGRIKSEGLVSGYEVNAAAATEAFAQSMWKGLEVVGRQTAAELSKIFGQIDMGPFQDAFNSAMEETLGTFLGGGPNNK